MRIGNRANLGHLFQSDDGKFLALFIGQSLHSDRGSQAIRPPNGSIHFHPLTGSHFRAELSWLAFEGAVGLNRFIIHHHKAIRRRLG